MKSSEPENPTGCCHSSSTTCERRKFLKTATGGALLASFGDIALNPKMVFAKNNQPFDNLIPADKGLSSQWFLELSRRENAEVYQGWHEQLQYIGMPVGGIGCGQLYLGGDGRLWLWDIFKSNCQREPDHGERLNSMSAGGHYAQPVAQGKLNNKWNGASVAQGFALKVQESGKVLVRTLDHSGFPEVGWRTPPAPYSHDAKFGNRNNRINHNADSTSVYSTIELSHAGRKRSDIHGIGSMASYGVFLAACGFDYHGPKGHIGFAPKISPDNFKAAFTAADGWGSYSQVISDNKMEATISLAYGSLSFKTIDLQLSEGFPQVSSALCNNTPIAFTPPGHPPLALVPTICQPLNFLGVYIQAR